MSTLALVLALAPTPDVAPLPAAEQAAARALDLWEEGRYDEARTEITRAYEIQPLRRYLYARARIEQADGHCDVANQYYERYLAEDPPPLAAKATRRAMAECDRELAEARTATTDEAVRGEVEPPPAPRPWWRDPIALGLVGSGTAVLAVGAGLFGRAFVEHRLARRTNDHDEFDRRVRRAKVLSPLGIAGISLGAALVVGGAVRWIVVHRRSRAASRVALGPTGVGLRW